MTTTASGSASASTTATGSSSSTSTTSGSNGSGGGGGVGGVTKRLTLLFVRRTNPETGAKEVLLGMKKRGFGLGKWNGFGGKVEPGETVPAAALRELEEEACVTAAGAELRGKITFTFQTIPDVLVSLVVCVWFWKRRRGSIDSPCPRSVTNVHFATPHTPKKVHVFEAQGPITGEPQETDEMRPQWYGVT